MLSARTTASQLHNSLNRLVENTSPQVEKALNNQRHQDDMSRIHYFSLVEENRNLRAQLDSEREKRTELMGKLQRHELLEEMRRIQAQAPLPHAYPPIYPQPMFAHPNPPPVAAPVAPVVPVVPVVPAKAVEEAADVVINS